MLLPRLMALNSMNFDFGESSFNEKMMKCVDKKDGLSREGCGRVAIYKLTELPNCYTLECNYTTSKRINQIAPKTNLKTGQIEPDMPINDINSHFYQNEQNNRIPPYTPTVFEDIGRSFVFGLLDFIECNPITRVPKGIYKCVDGVKRDIINS
jgi:hypothetical protein